MSRSNVARPPAPRSLASRAAAALLAAALTSCGFVNTDDDSAGGAVTAYVNTEQNTGLAPLVEAYREATGATVDLSSANTDELNQQIRVQLTSGTAADIIRVSPGYSSPVAAAVLGAEGQIADLSDAPWAGQLSPETKALAGVDGRVMALPLGRNVIVMAYNREVFANAGLTPPTTWSQLLSACRTLRDAGVTPIAAPFQGGVYLQFWVYALAATLVYAQQPDIDAQMATGATSFTTDPRWNEVFARFAELNEGGCFSDGMLGLPPDQGQQAVATGRAAMILTVSGGLPALHGYHEAGAQAFDVFALPATDDPAATHVPVAPDFLAVNAAAKDPAAARAFLDFLARPENVAAYANTMGVLPGLTVDVEIDSTVLAPVLPYVADGRTTAYANYMWPNGDVQQTLLQSGQEWLDGTIDTAALLGRMDADYAKGTP